MSFSLRWVPVSIPLVVSYFYTMWIHLPYVLKSAMKKKQYKRCPMALMVVFVLCRDDYVISGLFGIAYASISYKVLILECP
jgi:hypothetical protein